ncbi:MAG: tetratricopeptide repeat protein, partial [Phycisphaerae bacterium]
MPAPRFTHEVLLAILAWLTGICFHDAASGQDTGEPDAADRAYRAAVSYLHRELNDLAIEEYRKFLEVADAGHPQRPDARYGLAIAASRAENLDLAIASLHELNSINDYPRAVEARVLLGQCLLKTRQYREAATAFASASELSKKHPLLESAGALSIEAVYLGGEYEKVAEDGIVYLKKYPESRNQPRVAYFVADALLRLNKPEDAIKVAKRVLVSDGDHPLANAAQLVMARAYRLRKDYRQAADAYEALAARDIGALREDVLYELALVFAAQDEVEKAAGTLDELIGKVP